MAAPKNGPRTHDDGKPQRPSEYNGATPIPLRKKYRTPR